MCRNRSLAVASTIRYDRLAAFRIEPAFAERPTLGRLADGLVRYRANGSLRPTTGRRILVFKGGQPKGGDMFGRNKTGSKWANQAAGTQATLRSFFELIDPKVSVDSANELIEITEAVTRAGEWIKDDEWRISTWMKTVIKTEIIDGMRWFRVTVECDGQSLSCQCRTI